MSSISERRTKVGFFILVLHECCCWFSQLRFLFTEKLGLPLRQDLIEDVIISLSLELKGDTGLFQQICKHVCIMQVADHCEHRNKLDESTGKGLTCLYVSRGQLPTGCKVNSDKFTLQCTKEKNIKSLGQCQNITVYLEYLGTTIYFQKYDNFTKL